MAATMFYLIEEKDEMEEFKLPSIGEVLAQAQVQVQVPVPCRRRAPVAVQIEIKAPYPETTTSRFRPRPVSNIAPTSPLSDVHSITESVGSISVTDTTGSSDFTLDEEKKKTPRTPKKEIISERVAGALDKCRISGRCSVHIIVALLLELRLNPKDYNVSLSTISNRRNAIRKAVYDNVKDTLQVPRGAIVHFDGKIMDAITGKGQVDRLAAKETYKDIDQLIGVSIANDGTGLEIAAAVYQCLNDWKLTDSIDGCCYDTTSSNTGLDNGGGNEGGSTGTGGTTGTTFRATIDNNVPRKCERLHGKIKEAVEILWLRRLF
ncbi:uncharacterized protein LOC119082921 [Bradysia coprophila]|uniref:uncharacterized protein LOC119082921 n=1 Tax=Bradysia coprophila TaxID=38358 RepID=UPI00187D9A8B|nr:uncharacterized protein LOC119082921 [Bradysia coprophila]